MPTHATFAKLGLGLLILTACASGTTSEPTNSGVDGEDFAVEQDYTAGPPKASGPLKFASSQACAPGKRFTVGAIGDVLLHSGLQIQAAQSSARFRSLWSSVSELVGSATVSYANFEGPAAKGVLRGGRTGEDPGLRFDNAVYSSYPTFNYNPLLIDDLLSMGIDIVSASNNHALDRGSLGADRTIEAFREKGMQFTFCGDRNCGPEAWLDWLFVL
jgi:Bacterial capsule synthesis protein PGA_cap